MKIFILCVISLFLAGCLQFSTRDAIEDGTKGAANGFITSGPLGAIIGGITAAISGGFAVKKHRQLKRRERIVAHYRRTAGDLTDAQLAKVKEGIVVPG
jgi:hypothetical protein